MNTKIREIMVDLETMGTGTNSAIVAIGAVDSNGVSFGYTVSLESCIDAGLEMDASTVLWWLQQSDEARRIFAKDVPRAPLKEALSVFSEFVLGIPDPTTKRGQVRLWGNSAAFDLGLLGNAYDKLKMNRPWKYWEEACYRTLKNLRRDIPQGPIVGVKHNAVDDARSQLVHLQKLLAATQQSENSEKV